MVDKEVNTPTSIKILKTIDFTLVDPEVKHQVIEGTNPKTSVVKESLLRIKGAVDNLIKAQEKGYITVTIPEDSDEILDIELQPITDLPDVLGHITDPETYEANAITDVWGNTDEGEFTFVQTLDFSVEAFQENDHTISLGGKPKQFYRLYVDALRLTKLRDVYIDMESIDVTPEDFGKSFIVPRGIPRTAIQKAELIEISPRPLSEFLTDAPEEFNQDSYLKEAVRNEEKLRAFINSLVGDKA